MTLVNASTLGRGRDRAASLAAFSAASFSFSVRTFSFLLLLARRRFSRSAASRSCCSACKQEKPAQQVGV